MLERNIVTGEETNRYFLHHNGLAKEWEKFAEEKNGKIKGAVNGQILEFNLNFAINETRIHIYQIRQLSNKHSGAILDDGILMTKYTRIEIRPFFLTKSENWKIVKNNGWLQYWYNIIGFTVPLNYNTDYLLVSYKKLGSQDTLSKIQFDLLTKTAELKRIVRKNSFLKIEFNNVLGTDSVRKILTLILQPEKKRS